MNSPEPLIFVTIIILGKLSKIMYPLFFVFTELCVLEIDFIKLKFNKYISVLLKLNIFHISYALKAKQKFLKKFQNVPNLRAFIYAVAFIPFKSFHFFQRRTKKESQ